MEDQTCPHCLTSKYNNPSMKLLVNVCGHALCESCVDLIFLRGSGSCHQCQIPLRRNNFRIQLFDDLAVEKEIDIRRRLLNDYNKREEDFNTLQEYNDYLEEIETIIYNLCNDIDIINTNKRIETYKRENRENIQRNRARKSRAEMELDEIIAWEREQETQRRQELENLEKEHKKIIVREKEAFIDKLMVSKEDAKKIVNEFAIKAEKIKEEESKVPPPKPPSQFSTGIKFGQNNNTFLPIPKIEDNPLYCYKPPIVITKGPEAPSLLDIETKGYLRHIRPEPESARAAGFVASVACQRALQEAMYGLFSNL